MDHEQTAATTQPARRRPIDRGLLIASAVIATGVVLIGFAMLGSVTGDDRTNLPDAIERISPLPDAINVPNQSGIVVDLADGYTGRLIVDGDVYEAPNAATIDPAASAVAEAPEPGVQIVREAGLSFTPGVNTLELTLGDAIGIPRWSEGEHQVTVEFWRIGEPPANAETYRWQFSIV